MNQARIWCVVSPNVGLPLMLGGVTAIALIVRASGITHTTWFSNYWQGAAKTKTADAGTNKSVAAVAPQASPASAITVTPVQNADGKTDAAFLVRVAPGGNAVPASASAGTLALAGPMPH